MFEKEAEKRLPQAKIDYYNSFQCKPDEVPAIEMVRFGSGYTKGFIDGAEFGYNKANEWHYVKDGDLPKDDRCVLVYREDEEPQLDYYLNEEGYWKSEKWDREYYARKGENPPVSSIIAWKEIVLPELKESK